MEARHQHANGFHDLEVWKIELLQIWSQNAGRVMLDKDLISFSSILNLSVGDIKACFDDKRTNSQTQRAAGLDPPFETDPVSLLPSNSPRGKGRAVTTERSTSSFDLPYSEAFPEWALTPIQPEDDQLYVDSTSVRVIGADSG
jgi:hypothetical protein